MLQLAITFVPCARGQRMKNEQTEARRHHWVPQCYLRGFTLDRSADHQLFVVDCMARKSFSASPANVAVERDFNRIDAGAHSPNAVESAYSRFESRLAEGLKRIDASRDFSAIEDRNLVMDLITLLAVRSPRMRETMRRARLNTARIVIQQASATKERFEATVKKAASAGGDVTDDHVSYERFRSFVEQGKFDVDVPTTEHVRMELKLFAEVVPFLRARKWTLISASSDSGGFVTTDHPVVLMWSEPERTVETIVAGLWSYRYGCCISSVSQSRSFRAVRR